MLLIVPAAAGDVEAANECDGSAGGVGIGTCLERRRVGGVVVVRFYDGLSTKWYPGDIPFGLSSTKAVSPAAKPANTAFKKRPFTGISTGALLLEAL